MLIRISTVGMATSLGNTLLNVLVIAYTRPDKLSRLIDILTSNNDKIDTITFWVNQGCDEKSISESAKCIQIIDNSLIANTKIQRPASHLPVNESIPAALDYFFNNYDCGLVLEDDCLPSTKFIEYLSNMNTDDLLIDPISGSNPLSKLTSHNINEISYKKAFFFQVWGWFGTSNLWNEYRKNFEKRLCLYSYLSIYNVLRAKGLKMLFCFDFAGKVFLSAKGVIKTWDYQFSFYLIQHGILTWVPNHNLVENIGFDNSATNTFMPPKYYNYKNLEPGRSILFEDVTYIEFNKLYQATSLVSLLKTFRRWIINK